MLPFREITIEDKGPIEACSAARNYHLCEHCFVDLFIWKSHYNTRICFYNGFLLIRMKVPGTGRPMYLAPVGEGDLVDAIHALEQDAADRGTDFTMCSIPEELKAELEELLPGRYDYGSDPGAADYIYLSEKLQTLAGKKLQSKRNLVNRFLAAYEGRWSYEPLCDDNRHDAFNFHMKWCEQNGHMRDEDFWGETCAIGLALNLLDELDIRGGLLRLDGEVIAFTFGCRSAEDMVVVQIEKADHEIQGAYQMINQQFVQHSCTDVLYVNREEDLGLEGLRKAKQSYRPEMMGVKYCAVPRHEA